MTRPQAVGVLLVALGLIYALMYLGWVRRTRRNQAAAVAAVPPVPEGAVGEPTPTATVDAWALAEGTYLSTTTAVSRHERVAAAGLGARAKAKMVVDGSGVRWQRKGAAEVRVDAGRVTQVRRDRGMAGKFVGQPRLVVVTWRADDGSLYDTGFLPRYRVDIDKLLAAVDRLADQAAQARPDLPGPGTSQPPSPQTPNSQTPIPQTLPDGDQ